MKRTFLCAAVILGACGVAFGHAFVDHASPKVGSTVSVMPTEVCIWYTDNLQEAGSTIEVYDANGKEVDKKDSHLDGKDKSEMIVTLLPLSAGTYTVKWHAVCVDTHKTNDTFEFTYKPAG